MISVDFDSLVPPEFSAFLDDAFIETVLDDVAAAGRAKWIQLAQEKLTSSRRDYIQSIQDIEVFPGERVLSLVGWLANAVERGISEYNLRNTLLAPTKAVKTTRDGHRYRAIPFRHGTPDSDGQAGTPMGMRYGPQGAQSLAWAKEGAMAQGQAAALGKAVYAAAKALKKGQRLGQDTMSGHTVIDMGRGKSARRLQVPKLAPWHKTDIYAGMRKEQHTYRKATQSQYVTFRTISTRNPEGWIHPGIEARNLSAEVEAWLPDLIGPVIRSALRGLGGVTSG